MKILYVTNNYPTIDHPIFGIFVKEQVESIRKLGISCDLFFVNGRELGKYEYFRSIKYLNRKLLEEKYDLIHCHHALSAAIVLLTLRSMKIKKVVSYQNEPIYEGGILLFWIICLFFNKIIVKNEKSLSYSRKCTLLPNGVDINIFKEYKKDESKALLNLNSKMRYILFMDSYEKRKQKRKDRFNNTIEILKRNGNPLNIEPIILTNTERKYIPYYMSASEVHLLTSDFEGSPNSVKECLACNTKVVSTPVGDVKNILNDISGCFVADNFDSKELAKLIIAAIKVNNFNGRRMIIEKELDIESVARKLYNIYCEILDN